MSAIGTKRTCRVALHMSAIGGKADISFLGHLVLYEPNDRCDDRPSNAAANCLTEESTNIHAAGCTAQHRHKCGEDLTSNAASNCARDGIARRAEAHVLRRRTRCIATECTGYNLNYEIDECCRHMSLPCPQNGRLGGFILAALESAVARVCLKTKVRPKPMSAIGTKRTYRVALRNVR